MEISACQLLEIERNLHHQYVSKIFGWTLEKNNMPMLTAVTLCTQIQRVRTKPCDRLDEKRINAYLDYIYILR